MNCSDHCFNLMPCAYTGSIKAVCPDLRISFYSCNSFCQVGTTHEEALGPPDQHYVATSLVDCASRGSKPFASLVNGVNWMACQGGGIFNRNPGHARLNCQSDAFFNLRSIGAKAAFKVSVDRHLRGVNHFT